MTTSHSLRITSPLSMARELGWEVVGNRSTGQVATLGASSSGSGGGTAAAAAAAAVAAAAEASAAAFFATFAAALASVSAAVLAVRPLLLRRCFCGSSAACHPPAREGGDTAGGGGGCESGEGPLRGCGPPRLPPKIASLFCSICSTQWSSLPPRGAPRGAYCMMRRIMLCVVGARRVWLRVMRACGSPRRSPWAGGRAPHARVVAPAQAGGWGWGWGMEGWEMR